MNQRQINEGFFKFLMTYRCTPHSGTELLDPSYLIFILNHQIKNDFDLMRTKNPKIEYRNI